VPRSDLLCLRDVFRHWAGLAGLGAAIGALYTVTPLTVVVVAVAVVVLPRLVGDLDVSERRVIGLLARRLPSA
jgi:hypothetical protein